MTCGTLHSKRVAALCPLQSGTGLSLPLLLIPFLGGPDPGKNTGFP